MIMFVKYLALDLIKKKKYSMHVLIKDLLCARYSVRLLATELDRYNTRILK